MKVQNTNTHTHLNTTFQTLPEPYPICFTNFMLRGDIPLTRCPCRENSCLLCNNIPTSTPHSSDSSHSQGKELSVCVYGSDSCPATPCSLRKETDKTQKREKRKKQALNSNSTPMLKKKNKKNPTTRTAKLFLSDYINKKGRKANTILLKKHFSDSQQAPAVSDDNRNWNHVT